MHVLFLVTQMTAKMYHCVCLLMIDTGHFINVNPKNRQIRASKIKQPINANAVLSVARVKKLFIFLECKNTQQYTRYSQDTENINIGG